MKISEMILREDFYKVNEETLAFCYHDADACTELFVYSRINAIITRHPGKKVRRYLYTEYSIRGHSLKRWLIYAYMFLLFHSGGVFADHRISVQGRVENNDLIYPCNRKYRIFHFERNEVSVIVKAGFLTDTLQREILFRENSLEGYVLPVIEKGDRYYVEKIIDGVPLARMQDNYEKYLEEVLLLIQQLNVNERTVRSAKDYAEDLYKKIEYNLNVIVQYLRFEEREKIARILEDMRRALKKDTRIELGLSHGDLQPGNIWVERETDKIYIIDWESWGIRSTWYDKAVLLCDIRNGDGIRGLLNNVFAGLFDKDDYSIAKYIVALEDLLYKVTEVNSLPGEYGIRVFLDYIKINYSGVNIK